MAGIYTSAYSVDPNSNITGIGTGTYGYDALNRLTAENIGTATGYTYDLTDNRLTKVTGSTTTTTVPSTSNKISAVGSAAYTYDLAGNVTGDGTNTYTWNAAGQLETVKVGATTVGTYTYDYLGRRAKKVAGATTTYYAYNPNGLLYGEYTSTGTLVKEYVYLDDQPLAQIATGSPEVLTYLHTDHLGTPRYATNTAGAQVWAWPTDAFGISAPTGTVTVNLRLPGQYYDSESGLFYNWNRYYNPNIGRYISPDPIGQEGGLNLFSYVVQSPIMAGDPMGLDTLIIVGGRTSSNPLGHVALAFSGRGVYSFGTNTDPGSSLISYLERQSSYRSSEAYLIPTTKADERKMINYLESFGNTELPPYYTGDTCATRTNTALRIGGMDLFFPSPLPGDTKFVSGFYALSTGGKKYVISQGDLVPTALKEFNPQ